KLLQLVGGYPVFQMRAGTGLFDLELRQVLAVNVKFQNISHVAGTLIPRVPVAGDLDCVFMRQYRVEDGLIGKTGRKSRVCAGSDEIEFLLADRAIEFAGGHSGKTISWPQIQTEGQLS